MARVKRGVNAKKRHKNILKQSKGYFGAKSKLFRTANQAVMKSLAYSYVGRKRRKRDFRKLGKRRRGEEKGKEGREDGRREGKGKRKGKGERGTKGGKG